MTDISKLLAEARVILEKAKVAQQESRQRGEQFNIFHACGVNHYETRHSAILAEFLNPEGSHGQGDVYLKAFLDVVPFPFRFDTSTAKVTTEFPTSDGRMDILITNAKGQAVIIENKIYAGDQWEQLKRYNTFASRQYHAGNYAILYLTLWGNEASEQSGEGVDLKIANLATDGQILQYARNLASEVLDEDPELMSETYRILNERLKILFANKLNWRLIS